MTTLEGVADLLESKGMESRVLVDEGRPSAVFARGAGMRVDVVVAETAYQRKAIERAVDGHLTVR